MALNFLNDGYFAGKVGIGTETPGGNLHVVGETGSSGRIYLSDRDNGLGTGDALLINKAGVNASIYNRDSGSMNFGTNDVNDILVIANTGNVGIGTDDPNATLHLSGISQTGSKDAFRIENDTSNTKFQIKSVSGDYNLQFKNAGNVTRVFLNSNGDSYLTGGNVGIGTDSPTAAKLVVSSDTAPQLLIKSGGSSVAQILLEDNSGGTQNASITFDESSDNTLTIATGYVSPNDANKIVLLPGGTAAMTLRGGNDSTNTAGSILLNGYVGTRQTGTPTYLLGTDNSGNIVKTNTVPGSGAGPYLPLAGGTMTGTNGVLFPDNFKLKFGDATTPDLEIYHDGSNNFIKGAPNLYIQTNGAFNVETVSEVDMIKASAGSSVELYFAGTKRLETTSTGISVTGSRSIFAADTVVSSYSGTSVIEVYKNAGDSILTIHQDDGNHESKLHFRTGGNDTFIRVPASTNALQIDSETTTDAFILSHAGNGTFAGIIGVNGSTNANIPITATTTSGYEDVAYFKSAGTNINSRISLFPTGTGDGIVNSTANDLILQTSGVDRVTITNASATFGGNITLNGEIYGRTSTLYPGLGGLGFYSLVPYLENANQGGLKIKVQQGGSLVDSLTLDFSKNATFAGKATSVATAASDGSTTLTTKSYVDGLVTGVPVYKGTWAAGTTGVTSAAISSTTITLTAAPTETIAIGDVVTADGITAAITVTAVGSQTSVTVNASVTIASGVTVTFSSSNGGYPDLTLAAAKVLGNYLYSKYSRYCSSKRIRCRTRLLGCR